MRKFAYAFLLVALVSSPLISLAADTNVQGAILAHGVGILDEVKKYELNNTTPIALTTTLVATSSIPTPTLILKHVRSTTTPYAVDLAYYDNGATNEIGFVLERSSTASTTGFITLFDLPSCANTNCGRIISDSMVELNKTYYYRIKTLVSGGESAYSKVVVAGVMAPAGSFTILDSATSALVSRAVPANSTGVLMGSLRIRTQGEPIRLDQLPLKLSYGASSSPTDLVGQQASLYAEDGSQIGVATFVGKTATSLISNFTIPADSERTILIKGGLAPIGISQPGVSGHWIAIGYDGNNAISAVGVGVNSGKIIKSSSSQDTSSAPVIVYRHVPIVNDATAIGGGNTLVPSSDLYKFTIMATPATQGGEGVQLYKVSFVLATSSVRVKDFVLYGPNGPVHSGFVNMTDYRWTGAQQQAVMEVIFDLSSSDRIILPGQMKTYVLRASSVQYGTGATSALSIQMLGDSSLVVSKNKFMADADTLHKKALSNFIWSPISNGSAPIATSTVDFANGFPIRSFVDFPSRALPMRTFTCTDCGTPVVIATPSLSHVWTRSTTTPYEVKLMYSDNGVTNETGFVLERSSTASTTGFTALFDLPLCANFGTAPCGKQISDSMVELNKTYYYRIKTLVSGSESAYSKVVRVLISPSLPTDTVPPVVSIVLPGADTSTDKSTMVFSAAATDNIGGTSGISRVVWSTNKGYSGSAVAGYGWVATIPLDIGTNVVTYTAYDAVGNFASASRTITRTQPTGDITPPVVTIVLPGSDTSTTKDSIVFSATATDNNGGNQGVKKVLWSTSRGYSGSAVAGYGWVATIPLDIGTNVVTYSAYDAAGNIGTASRTITRTTSASKEAEREENRFTRDGSAPIYSSLMSGVTSFFSNAKGGLDFVIENIN